MNKTLEKEGWRIGDRVQLNPNHSFFNLELEIIGFVPESYEEQNLPVPTRVDPINWIVVADRTAGVGTADWVDGLNGVRYNTAGFVNPMHLVLVQRALLLRPTKELTEELNRIL